METRAQILNRAKINGFRFSKVQREVGCESCQFLDLEAAIKQEPYCCAPVKFGEMTIEVIVTNYEWVEPDIRHRCHKYQRIEGTERSESPILDNGGRNVARLENTGEGI